MPATQLARPRMPAAPARVAGSPWIRDRLPLVLAVLAVGLGAWARLPLLDYNLPVAAHVDERNSVNLLLRLKREGLDPGFFNYPTLYFYLNALVLGPLEGVEAILRGGRWLNLVFACAAALASYAFGALALRSRWAGAVGAALMMVSPIATVSASYIITDVLFAVLVTSALTALGVYFSRGSLRAWTLGVVLMGLATATKYNAAAAVIAYLTAEFLRSPEPIETGLRATERRFRSGTVALVLAVLGTLALGVGLATPQSFFLGVLESGQGLNSRVDANDLAFLEGMRRKAVLVGAGSLGLALLCWRRRQVELRFSRQRPVIGVAIAVLVFLAASPYVLLSFRRFLFDFGYELKMNGAGDEAFWAHYPAWFVEKESLWVGLLAVVGVATCIWSRRREATVALLFLGFSYLLIGSATRGFPRYLTPLLPVLFALAGLGVMTVAETLRRRAGGGVAALAVTACVSVVALELGPKLATVTARAGQFDEMHASFHEALETVGEGTVVYAGHVPFVELREAGIPVRELPYTRLEEPDLAAELAAGDLLLLDGRARDRLSAENRAAFRERLGDERGWRQYVLDPSVRP